MIVKKDMFNIEKRLKKINKNYFIVFNKMQSRFEVHFKNQKGSTFCFCVDKPYLTADVIKKAHLTNVRNIKNIIKTIDENNLKIEKECAEKNNEKNKYLLNDLLKYADDKNYQGNFFGFDSTKWF